MYVEWVGGGSWADLCDCRRHHPRRPSISSSLTRSPLAHSFLCRPSLARLRLTPSQRPIRATKSQLTRFHTDEYIDLLEAVMPETAEALTGNGTRCLTGEDCPAFEGVFEFCTISAGGSIGAAERICQGETDIAINWAGGLHHAKKTEASGFCYVNDM